jgi:hypothetical protein
MCPNTQYLFTLPLNVRHFTPQGVILKKIFCAVNIFPWKKCAEMSNIFTETEFKADQGILQSESVFVKYCRKIRNVLGSWFTKALCKFFRNYLQIAMYRQVAT